MSSLLGTHGYLGGPPGGGDLLFELNIGDEEASMRPIVSGHAFQAEGPVFRTPGPYERPWQGFE